MSYNYIHTISFGYEQVPHCVGCLIDDYDVKINIYEMTRMVDDCD